MLVEQQLKPGLFLRKIFPINIYWKLRIIPLAFLLLLSLSNMAQSDLLLKTIDSANQLRDAGNFEKAALVLNNFNTTYPGNSWILRLQAETLFWMKNYSQSALVYEEAINFYPDDLDIKYEYAIMLFEWGKYEQAKSLLETYTSNNPDVAGAESLLGATDFYLGNFKDAEKHLEISLKLNPGDEKTKEIYQQVSLITKPWLQALLAYSDDSQPLKNWVPAIQSGWYHSNLLSLSFLINFQNLSSDSLLSNRFNFQVSNNFNFAKTGISATVSAGTFYTSVNQSYDYTWGVSLQKIINKHLFIRAIAERSPYTYTVASIVNPFARNQYSFSVAWEKPKSWNANAGYIGEYFPDTNNVQTAYAWVLSPSFSFSIFDLNLGYSINYANAKESRYVPEQSTEEIINNFEEGATIAGVYNPYFTPNQQFVNSALANLFIKPSKNILVKLHAGVGFYAHTQNPYFYLDNMGNGNGNTIVKEGFYGETYTPLDLGINFNANLTEKIILNLSYAYLKTFYFNSNNFLFSLKFYF